MSKAHGTKFCASLDEVSINGPTMALISGRTADNPRLLKEVIDLGCTAVYLEKPGAPTVKELEEMRAYAKSKGVQVFMGYNKTVTPDAAFSECKTLTGPGGKQFTDFAKVGFTVETKDGKTITLMIDRCGSDS